MFRYNRAAPFAHLIFIFLSTYYFNSVVLAETIKANISEKDFISFDNYTTLRSRGQCHGMAMAVSLSPALFICDPAQPRQSETALLEKLSSAYQNEIPIVIEGVESFKELSTEWTMREFVERLQEWQSSLISGSLGQELGLCNIRTRSNFEERKKSVDFLLNELRSGVPIEIGINTEPSSSSVNHAILVIGAEIIDNNNILFEVYDPNIPHQKTVRYLNGEYYYEGHVTPLDVGTLKFEKIKRAYERKQRIQKIRNSLEKNYTGFGYIVKKNNQSGFFLRYGDNFIPLESNNYQLEALAGNGVRVFVDGDMVTGDKSIRVDKIYYESIERAQVTPPENHLQGYIEKASIEGGMTFYFVDNQGKKYELKGEDPNTLKTFLGSQVSINGDITELSNKTYLQIKEIKDLQPLVVHYYSVPPRLTQSIMSLRSNDKKRKRDTLSFNSIGSVESGGELAINDLVQILRYGDKTEKFSAINSLVSIEEKSNPQVKQYILDILKTTFTHENPKIKSAILNTLELKREAYPLFISALDDKDERVRETAISILSSFAFYSYKNGSNQELISKLIKGLNDSSVLVKNYSTHILKEISDKLDGNDPIKMKIDSALK